MPAGRAPPPVHARGSRDIYDTSLGRILSCPVYPRVELAPGCEIDGPAIIAEDETSTFIPANFRAALNSSRYIVMESTAEAAP